MSTDIPHDFAVAPRPLSPIPLFRSDAPTEASDTDVSRGVAQARMSVKQAGAGSAGGAPTVFDAPPVQRKNATGLPDALKEGVEALSGVALDDVRVHYNSANPATVQALAYTQGTEIHVGPQQERHLPHEAWHVVQQKQGRVQPTLQMRGVAINDDVGLEHEADTMGARATEDGAARALPLTARGIAGPAPIQRKIGFEYEMPMVYSALATPVTKEEKKKFVEQVERVGRGKTVKKDFTGEMDLQRRNYLTSGELVDNKTGKDVEGSSTEQMGNYRFHALAKKEKIVRGTGFTLEADEGNAMPDGSGASVTEFVTDAFDEGDAGRQKLDGALKDLEKITTKITTFANAGKRKVVHAAEVASGGLVGKVIYPSKQTNGVLQVTSAVDLARIPELMKNMNASEGESKETATTFRSGRDALGPAIGGSQAEAGPTGKAPVGAEKAIQDHMNFAFFDDREPPPTLGSEELHGLVSLLASYMMSANNNRVGYAKTIAPIMARTDFAAMFEMLNKDEKEYFKKDPAALVDIVRFATGGLDMQQDVFPHGIYNDPRAKGGEKDALKGLTRARWVTGITTGTDYFSAAKFNQNPDLKDVDTTEKKGDLESMGAMGTKTEKVGSAKKDAPIFEIRSLGQLSTPEQMHLRALAIFDFLTDLNEEKNATFK